MIKTIQLTCLSVILLTLGCTSTRTSDTARTGMEQLLISNAVDQTLDKTALPPVDGRKIYIEEKYLDGAVDKGYVVAKMRQKILNNGGMLVDKKDDSEITIELCSGGVGTDNVSSFVGMPGLAVPGLPIELPEVRVYEKSSQFGTAKIGVVAYATGNGQLIYDSGTPLARANDSRWSILGIGPFRDGSVRDEVITHTNETDFTARVANTVNLDNLKR